MYRPLMTTFELRSGSGTHLKRVVGAVLPEKFVISL
jgi:hypothetical protein